MDSARQPASIDARGRGSEDTQATGRLRAIGPIGTAARLVAGLLLIGNVAYGQLVTQHVRPATWALGLLGFPALVLAWHVWRIRRHPARFSHDSPLSYAVGALLFLALYFTWWYAPALSVTSDAALIFFGGALAQLCRQRIAARKRFVAQSRFRIVCLFRRQIQALLRHARPSCAGIYVFGSRQGKDVDCRNKSGHDDSGGARMESAEPRRPSERSIPGSLPK